MNTPFYVNITENIRDQIVIGKYRQGDQIPPMSQLCKMYNVSEITIRKALAKLKDSNYLSSIKGKGYYVSTHQCAAPAHDKFNDVKRIFLITNIPKPDGYRGFGGSIIDGILREANRKQVGFRSDYLPSVEIQGTANIPDSVSDDEGIIAFSGFPSLPMISMLMRYREKAVLVDSIAPAVNCVLTDNMHGVFEILRHLKSLGHRKYILAYGHPHSPNATNENERMHAFSTFIESNGLEGQMILADRHDEIIKKIKEKGGPTAVCFNQDHAALSFIKTAESEGIRVPGKISVTGFDGFSLMGNDSGTLTTYKVNVVDLARLAVETTLNFNKESNHLSKWQRVKGKIVIGRTTAKI